MTPLLINAKGRPIAYVRLRTYSPACVDAFAMSHSMPRDSTVITMSTSIIWPVDIPHATPSIVLFVVFMTNTSLTIYSQDGNYPAIDLPYELLSLL